MSFTDSIRSAQFNLQRAQQASVQQSETRKPEDLLREAACFAQEASAWFAAAADEIEMRRAEEAQAARK